MIRFRRSRLALVASGAVVLALAVSTTSVTAAAATPAAPAGGGWVAAPTSVHAAQVTFAVPTVRCAARRSATVSLGLFGTTTAGTQSSPWQLTVIASCHRGRTTYRGVASDVSGTNTVLAVHAGDRVRLLVSGVLSYEIDNYTTGEAAGSGSAVSGGPQPVLGTPVLFGARVSGTVRRGVAVHVSHARINRHALTRVPRHRQPQVIGGHRVVRSSTLGKDGSFTLTVAAT